MELDEQIETLTARLAELREQRRVAIGRQRIMELGRAGLHLVPIYDEAIAHLEVAEKWLTECKAENPLNGAQEELAALASTRARLQLSRGNLQRYAQEALETERSGQG